MKTKKYMYVSIIPLLIFLLMCIPGFACEHGEVVELIICEAGCSEAGQGSLVCEECGKVTEQYDIPAKGHAFGDYEVIRAPRLDESGVKARFCKSCGAKDSYEFECKHGMVAIHIVQAQSCAEWGLNEYVCWECGAVVKTESLEPLAHETYTAVTKEPTCKESGVESVICKCCGRVIERHALEKAEHETYTVVAKKATCTEAGVEKVICKLCGEVVKERALARECAYGKWKYTKYATPVESGERYRECSECGNKECESYSVDMKKRSIYIPGAGISTSVVVSSFTKAAIDKYDVVYTEKACGADDPVVFGHNTGTMRTLYKTKIGQKIYLRMDDKIEVYEVRVSEYGLESEDKLSIVGQETGLGLFTVLGDKTLHLYTCYGSAKRGRWIVVARLIDTIPA